MSIEQYQRIVNNLDKEIATLEQKKASFDKKAADQEKKAAGVSISKNASASMINSKKRQIERYSKESNKSKEQSANLMKKIADKRKKRNDAYSKLQKEQQLEIKRQNNLITNMQRDYEKQIEELTSKVLSFNEKQVAMTDTINEENEKPEYDVFISHAWEDKEDFVNDFVKDLNSLGVTTWYDKSQILWGDSMRKKIDEGLKKSRFGIVILSPNYIAEGKYWTKAELDGLFQLESINGKKLLPIWHKLTKKEVMDFSPTIAGKLAMNTSSLTSKEIAEKMQALLENINSDQ
ncbi:toll/interleukin-1 receptor domain-containing protein [Faecalibacillus faecis]|uniref:toll/interleukin-1 receptor domain-containing protein n=1 Tax=Faecalibacillus faecis TaxID=1982628 RepID=UPI0022E7FAD2|nr:toll/interleukin-1 receptor domain-containing protein [Faecalibacillus faecis]